MEGHYYPNPIRPTKTVSLRRPLQSAIAILAVATMPISAASLSPDLAIVNASIHTMDPRQPQAEAVAIWGNRIMAVGSSEEVRVLANQKTRLIDAQKRPVFPGFNDAH